MNSISEHLLREGSAAVRDLFRDLRCAIDPLTVDDLLEGEEVRRKIVRDGKPVPYRVLEAVTPGGRLDPVRGVVYGVKVVGIESRKGRKYPLDVLKRAIPLYEGRSVYIDHPTRDRMYEPRPFAAKFGSIKNVRAGSNGLHGDLYFNVKHNLADQFIGWVENCPNEIGLSHSATASLREASDGTKIVTEILSVESVDLVATPATTQGLFESLEPTSKRSLSVDRLVKELAKP